MRLFVLFSMLFLHVVDDWYLQGKLGSMKQKFWWEEHAPDVRYRKDYVIALLIHGFSWAFLMMLPLTMFVYLQRQVWYPSAYIVNMSLHSYVDHLKCNKFCINLIEDQVFHVIQIVVTWWICLYIF